jgi:hypothetical protein
MERPTPFAAAAFHECQANRGLPSGTAEPHGFGRKNLTGATGCRPQRGQRRGSRGTAR